MAHVLLYPPDYSTHTIQWECSSNKARKRRFREYEASVQEQLFAAYATDTQGAVQIVIDNWHYTVCFARMVQINNDTGYDRRIRITEDDYDERIRDYGR